MTTTTPTPRPIPTLPDDGRRIGFFGKGGSGKSMTAGHCAAYWNAYGLPAAFVDTDVPGEGENGTLYEWADTADIGAPVYPAPASHRLRTEILRLTPAGGLLGVDTGPFERRNDRPNMAILSSVDLAVLFMQPTRTDMNRIGSFTAAIEQLADTGARTPAVVILLTMCPPRASSVGKTRKALTLAGHTVLEHVVPLSNSQRGLAQSFGRAVDPADGAPMDHVAREILHHAATAGGV